MVFWTLLFGNLLITNFLNGFVEAILYSILPDLRCLLNTDLNSLSYLFLAYTLGFVPGYATAHYVIMRSRPFPTLFVLVLTQSIALSVLPLAPVIYVTAVCIWISGFTNASILSVLLHLLGVYWTGSTRRVYVLLSLFSAGSVACPLILQPFLGDGTHNQTINGHVMLSGHYTPGNGTIGNTSLITVSECQVLWQYPCFVITFIGVCVSFFHLMFHFKVKDETQPKTYVDMIEDTNRIEPTKLHMVFVFLFFLPSFPMTFVGLLTSYGTSGPQIDLSTLNNMLSVFYASFLACRVLPTFLPVSIKQIMVMSVALIGQFLGGLLLVGNRFSREPLLWSSCVLLGSSGGAYFPTGLAWAGETLNMNPARTSVCLMSMATGFLLPYVCGYLMSLYGDEIFEYFILSIGVYSGFAFVLLNIVLYVFKTTNKLKESSVLNNNNNNNQVMSTLINK